MTNLAIETNRDTFQDHKLFTISFTGDRETRNDIREKLRRVYSHWQFISYLDSNEKRRGMIRFLKKEGGNG